MQILVNGQRRTVNDVASVSDLLALMSLEPRRVAVERNKQIVPRGKYGETLLSDRDVLEIVTLVGGG